MEFTEAKWSDDELQRGMRQLPALIYQQNTEANNLEAEVAHTKHVLELARAGVRVDHIGKKLTATELNAMAYKITAETQELLIEQTKKLELAKSRATYLDDCYTSIKKSATLRAEELKTIEPAVTRRQQ